VFEFSRLLAYHKFVHFFFKKPFYLSHEYYVAEDEVLGALHVSGNPLKRMNLHFLINGANYIENFILPYA
jgi:hypothetical protein